MKNIKWIGLLAGTFIASIGQCFSQTNLQFTGVSATAEGAILLNWASTNGELYQVQYANALATNDDGSTAWQVLYDNYPSHGTNTFIGDYGNYDVVPVIPHPKTMPMRFYKILDEGADTAAGPYVAISSPSPGDVLSGQITVSVVSTSSLPVLSTSLYVDGQQMDESDDGSNYVLNTCEWLNGSHTLYAVATTQSAMSGPSGGSAITVGHAVSPYVTVTFNNLISEVAFSQPFFEPSLGQTQEVTANFAANCDWSLQIEDENSNVVRSASGSGNTLVFDWDGTGDGETNIPDAVYYYWISAATNGLADDLAERGSLSASLASSSIAGLDASELWAVPADSTNDAMPIPFALYPPGFDTNNLTVFAATPSEIESLKPPRPYHVRSSRVRAGSYAASFRSGGVTADDSGGGSGEASAQATMAPTRPPTSPVKNAGGTYAIGYYSWPNDQSVAIPKNYVLGVCHLDGATSSSSITYHNIPEAQTMSVNMIQAMKRSGWELASLKGDQQLPVNSIRRSDQGYGGGEYFTAATIGLFLDHGDYGTDPDYNPGSSGSKQTYFRSDVDGGDNGWLRMCQFGFGGNLKWMALLACDSFPDPNYSSMKNAGAIPLKTTHLACGASTIIAVGEDIGAYWAKNMLRKKQMITDAWFNAGRSQYDGATGMPNPTTFRVVGYPECMSDTVQNNTAPSTPSASPGNLTKQDSQVYP